MSGRLPTLFGRRLVQDSGKGLLRQRLFSVLVILLEQLASAESIVTLQGVVVIVGNRFVFVELF